MKINAGYLLAVFVGTLAACSRQAPPEVTGSPAPTMEEETTPARPTASDWVGVYAGIVPDGEEKAGVETALRLLPDTTYTLTTRRVEASAEPETYTGRFSWEPGGQSLKLLDIDSTDRPIYYKVGKNYLRQMDMINVPIEGSLSQLYYLNKDVSGLMEQRWELVRVAGEEVKAMKRPPSLYLEANGNRASGFAGCNTYRGTYTLERQGLSFPPMMATKMACEDLDLEQHFLNALRLTMNYRMEDGMLVLLDNRQEELATLRAAEARNMRQR
ncbi:META domain-containing protein [Neolewinella litorea]|uniref:META domain-containing protein n=1 Tax=Neolewinella litorea TaxID=2562452 RepID=A0A4S4NMV6_9BACT|nr:META domain-containing protein [Neolewinella litorea]THH41274.1 META domain-containing protein [Neolewinella litorea]